MVRVKDVLPRPEEGSDESFGEYSRLSRNNSSSVHGQGHGSGRGREHTQNNVTDAHISAGIQHTMPGGSPRISQTLASSSTARNMATNFSALPQVGRTRGSQEKQSAQSTQRRRSMITRSMTANPQAEVRQEIESKRSKITSQNCDPARQPDPSAPLTEANPPSYLLHKPRHPGFTAFNGILARPHLIYVFACAIDLDTLISLYAISRDFHIAVNQCMTGVVLEQALKYSPTGSQIFPFRCYRKLCIEDPYVGLDLNRGRIRMVPSFRYVRMLIFREIVVRRLYATFNKLGLHLPPRAITVMKKIWFIMDIPENARRIGAIQNKNLWSKSDLLIATLVFIRIDMRSVNPIIRQSHGGIRRLLMAQSTLTTLYRVMTRQYFTNIREALQLYIRWKYRPHDNLDHQLFGIPRSEAGRVQYEYFGAGNSTVLLQRPDELVMKECVHRRLDIRPLLFRLINWGGDKSQWEDIVRAVD